MALKIVAFVVLLTGCHGVDVSPAEHCSRACTSSGQAMASFNESRGCETERCVCAPVPFAGPAIAPMPWHS